MTNQQAPSDPLGEAFMSKMEKAYGVKFVDATPKEAPSESDWEKEFEGSFPVGANGWGNMEHDDRLRLLAFIRKVRAEAVEEALEKVLPEKAPSQKLNIYELDGPNDGWNDCRDEVICRIEAIKKELTDPK